MKVPVLPTVASALCVVLSLWFVIQTMSIRSGREALLKQQETNRKLQQDVEKQNEEAQRQTKVFQTTQGIAQIRQGDLQSQQRTIETGATVAQKFGPPILREIGFLAADRNNEKLKNLLSRYKLEGYIPNAEQLAKMKAEAAKAKP
jgi:hypothetical protein